HWSTLIPEHDDAIIGAEARGVVLGAPLAYEIGAGVVPVRTPGKLPGEPAGLADDLEAGGARHGVPQDSFPAGARVLMVDDLLATGGTAAATLELARRFDVDVLGATFLIELVGLGGRDRLPGTEITTIWRIED